MPDRPKTLTYNGQEYRLVEGADVPAEAYIEQLPAEIPDDVGPFVDALTRKYKKNAKYRKEYDWMVKVAGQMLNAVNKQSGAGMPMRIQQLIDAKQELNRIILEDAASYREDAPKTASHVVIAAFDDFYKRYDQIMKEVGKPGKVGLSGLVNKVLKPSNAKLAKKLKHWSDFFGERARSIKEFREHQERRRSPKKEVPVAEQPPAEAPVEEKTRVVPRQPAPASPVAPSAPVSDKVAPSPEKSPESPPAAPFGFKPELLRKLLQKGD